MSSEDLKNYPVDEAVEILGCKKSYLLNNLGRFQHQKIGREVVFDAEDLRAFKEMHRVRPAQDTPTAQESTAPTSYRDLRPVGGRRRTA
jgi:hypothetical protein